MPKILKKLLVAVVFAFVLGYQIVFTPPPTSWENAPLSQVFMFFIPVIMITAYIADILLKNFARSFFVGLSAMFLVILQSIYLFNIITLAIVLLCLTILIYIFDTPPQISHKTKSAKITKSLTSEAQIPKLTKFQQKRRQDQRRRRRR